MLDSRSILLFKASSKQCFHVLMLRKDIVSLIQSNSDALLFILCHNLCDAYVMFKYQSLVLKRKTERENEYTKSQGE